MIMMTENLATKINMSNMIMKSTLVRSDTRGISRTSTSSKVELSVTVGNKFQPLTNVKKNFNILCGEHSRYPSVDTVKLGKTLKNMGNFFAKIVKSSFLIKQNWRFRFTNEETRIIFFKDLSCTLWSKRISRQYLKFYAFSILAIQLTRWAVRIQEVWNFNRALP